jgi:hypothetical protein
MFPLLSMADNPQPSPIGNWKVVSDYAPDGFRYSKVKIAFEEEKYLLDMDFEEIGYKLKGEKISFVDGVFKFSLYIEGEDVLITMKFNGEDKMTGIATTSAGEVPLEAIRIKEQKY